MATSIQDQLDEQVETQTENATVDIADMPLLTDAAIRNDARRVDICEINFSTQTARIVGTSDAPKLTLGVVREHSAPVQPAKMIFDQQEHRVNVKMGVIFSVNARHTQLLKRFEGKPILDDKGEHVLDKNKEPKREPLSPEKSNQLNRAVKNLYISEMIDAPQFSFEGEGKGTPIEDVSDVLADALFSAYVEKNQAEEDNVFQITVLRGQPIHAAILMQDSFDAFPAPLQKEVASMSPQEIEMTTQRSLAQRRILVSSMVYPEGFLFSLNGEGGEGELYPIESISELWLQTLHAGYRASNIPEAGLQIVSRFSVSNGNGNREEISEEGVS